MKKIINREGFHKAMRAGMVWTTLDCMLSELEDGTWYWEIDKHVFTGAALESTTGLGDASWEQLDNGYGLQACKHVWNNFIEKHNPDEYFVDQSNYEKPE